MRVLEVMESTIGGTRRHIVDLSRGLARRGVETHLVAAAEREPAFRDDLTALASEGVHVTELPMCRAVRPFTDFGHWRELKQILRRVRPDVVHTHSSKAGALGRMASTSTGIGARVHTPHTFAFLFSAMFSPAKRALYRRIETSLGARTDRLVAVSESEAETIRGAGVVDPGRVRVVPNGIDPAPWEAARPVERGSLGVPADAPLLLVAGLLNSAKGQDLAVRALAEPGLDTAHLVLAGHGEDEPALRALADELGVANRVHLLGWRDDLPGLVAASDVVVVPSRWEGLPYIVLEAGAAGRPVVGTRVDGVRELVTEGETGALCEPEDVGALAAALERVLALGAEGRRELGQRARRRVAESFTAERMVERMLAVYAEVA